MKELVIIVLNYNDFEETVGCVDNLLKIGIKENIIVVDNKSSNNSFEFLKEKYEKIPNITVIESDKNGGYSYGNNFGIKYAIKMFKDVEFFGIMNPDVRISYSKLLINLVEKLKKNEDIAAMSPVMILNGYLNYDGMCWDLPDEKTIYSDHILFLKNRKRQQKIKIDDDFISRVQVIPGSFFIIKRKALEEIGLLDEKVFLYNEENILSQKLLKIGKKVALSINDYYEHNHKKKQGKLSLKQRLINNKIGFQSRKYLCQQFYRKKSLRRLEIINVLNVIYIYIISVIKRG